MIPGDTCRHEWYSPPFSTRDADNYPIDVELCRTCTVQRWYIRTLLPCDTEPRWWYSYGPMTDAIRKEHGRMFSTE